MSVPWENLRIIILFIYAENNVKSLKNGTILEWLQNIWQVAWLLTANIPSKDIHGLESVSHIKEMLDINSFAIE